MNENLVLYYELRAKQYERVYKKAEWQAEIDKVDRLLHDIFNNQDVFEVACGTGFWTEKIARTAGAIYAIDINESVISIAKDKHYPKSNVRFQVADFFSFEPLKSYDSLFGGFIWSHIPLQNLRDFLEKIHKIVKPGGTVFFIDTNHVEGHNRPIAKKDTTGNTFQIRRLDDSSEHLVLKNFPTEKFIRQQLSKSLEVKYVHLTYFWLVWYRV